MIDFSLIKKIFKSRSEDFWLFEFFTGLSTLATSIISVFIPVFLYQYGFSIKEIILYFIILYIIDVPLNFLVGKIIQKTNSVITIIFSVIFIILYFILFMVLEHNVNFYLLFLLAVLGALYDAFYYVSSLHLFVGSNQNIDNTGKNTGLLNNVINFFGLLGPIVGSIYILYLGSEDTLIYIVIFFLIVSLIPLFYLKKIKKTTEQKIASPMVFFREMKEQRNFSVLAFYKIEEAAEWIIFPLFIFIFFGTLNSVAFLAVATPFFAMVTTYLAGNIKIKVRHKAIAIASFLLFLIWIGRIFWNYDWWYYLSIVLSSIVILFVQVPLDSSIFRRAKIVGSLSSSIYRNAVGMGVKGLFFIILYFLPNPLNNSFFLILIGLVLIVVLEKDYSNKYRKSIG